MAANFGAHEVMEIHEILSDTITVSTQFSYTMSIVDPQLKNLVNKQQDFMSNEFNNMVNAINRKV